jgi:uncharacterized membrane protein YccC
MLALLREEPRLDMGRITVDWKQIRLWAIQHHAELRLCLRVSVSAMLALLVAQLLNLPFVLWTVLTAVILTQISVGGSVKATLDYLASTIGGAVYAGAVGALIPHTNEIVLLASLAIAVAPPALVAATNPRFRAAPFTAVMVFFAPGITHAGPIASAFERVIEVGVGAIVGLVVSLLVLPARAHEVVVAVAGRMLALIAEALPQLLAGCTHAADEAAIRRVQDTVGSALARVQAIAPEAQHEHIAGIAGGLDCGPLLRTLLRLRHDLVMIGRATVVPLPESLCARLGERVASVANAAANYLRAASAALTAGRPPPSLAAFEVALEAYSNEVAAVRAQGLTRELGNEALERLFALGFTLELMHRHFIDLARCLTEFAAPSRA